MKKQPTTYLLVFLIFLACIGFVYGIFKACQISLESTPDPKKFPDFLTNTVTSIATVLATNLGAVLGVSSSQPTSNFRQPATWNPLNLLSGNTPDVTQAIACYLYVLGLLAAVIVWANLSFVGDPTKVVALIPELSKSLLGVVIGALAVSLK